MMRTLPQSIKRVEIDGIVYDEYVFVRNKALEAGAMTEWNVWNFIGISKDADRDDIQKAIDAGALTKAEDGTISFNVLVQADAIQAEALPTRRPLSPLLTRINKALAAESPLHTLTSYLLLSS